MKPSSRFSEKVDFPFDGTVNGKRYRIVIDQDEHTGDWRCAIDFNPRLPLKVALVEERTDSALRRRLIASGFPWPPNSMTGTVCGDLLARGVIREM